MYKVYGDINSGNCYKVKLLMSLLDVEHEWIVVSILNGGTQTDDFKRKNPNAKIPTLELADGTYLWESNAILNFLAAETSFLPNDPLLRAKVLQWQFFEQYSHEPYIAVARFIAKYLGMPEERKQEYRDKQRGGHKALAVMEKQLRESKYLVDDQYTIADISLYAYTHVAHEGGFDLAEYSEIQKWMARISSEPKHVTMEQFIE
jgi:glutathione S-transferase